MQTITPTRMPPAGSLPQGSALPLHRSASAGLVSEWIIRASQPYGREMKSRDGHHQDPIASFSQVVASVPRERPLLTSGGPGSRPFLYRSALCGLLLGTLWQCCTHSGQTRGSYYDGARCTEQGAPTVTCLGRHYGTPASDVQALSLAIHKNVNLRATIAVVPTITSESSSRRGSAHLDK